MLISSRSASHMSSLCCRFMSSLIRAPKLHLGQAYDLRTEMDKAFCRQRGEKRKGERRLRQEYLEFSMLESRPPGESRLPEKPGRMPWLLLIEDSRVQRVACGIVMLANLSRPERQRQDPCRADCPPSEGPVTPEKEDSPTCDGVHNSEI